MVHCSMALDVDLGKGDAIVFRNIPDCSISQDIQKSNLNRKRSSRMALFATHAPQVQTKKNGPLFDTQKSLCFLCATSLRTPW
jgi:hypothetical protein